MRTLPVALALLSCPGAAAAQTGSPAPSYGASLPKELDGHQVRFFRTLHLSVSAKVPRAELQRLLPAGFTAQPLPGDKDASRIVFGLYVQQRAELVTAIGAFAAGTYGPDDTMNVTTVTDTSAGPVVLFLDSERSTEASAALANALYGAGSARAASGFDTTIEQRGTAGTMRIRARVVNPALKKDVGLEVVAPTTGAASSRRVTPASPVDSQRSVDGARPPKANRLFKIAAAGDQTPVPVDGVKLSLPGSKLGLPQGSLTVLGVDATGTNRVNRWFEVFVKLE